MPWRRYPFPQECVYSDLALLGLKGETMKHRLLGLALSLAVTVTVTATATTAAAATTAGHYVFVFAGDAAKKGNDFLVVIDADPASPNYGHAAAAVATAQRTVRPHHTEYTMPASGMLFANDHDAGQTFIFDVRDPLHPSLATTFGDIGGYAHPHSYLRLPNGHVLATFQHDHGAMQAGRNGKTGGLVEIDDAGKLVRSVSNADPAFADALLMPYSLAVLPAIDRVLVSNSSMHDPDILSGTTIQVFRLSDLKLLKTAYLDVGRNRYEHISPEEPRVGPDGAVYLQTLGCGVERISAIGSDTPAAKLVYAFPGNWCGVPTIVGHYFVQSVPAIHGFIVLDIADGTKPVEVSRLTIDEGFFPHWTGWDSQTNRLVVTPDDGEDRRMYLLKLDPGSGALSIDETFRDSDGKPGFSFANREWPHGWRGAAMPHGAVFSRGAPQAKGTQPINSP